MTADLIVVGAGGFGRETLDVIEALNARAPQPVFRVIGIVDDGPNEANLQRLGQRGYRHIGGVDESISTLPPAWYVVAIGNPNIKRRLAERFDGLGWNAAVIVHPAASVGSKSVVSPGSVICGGVQISTNVDLGRHVHLNPSVTVGHDTQVGDFTSVNPGAILSGEVRVEHDVLIGAGAVVLQGLTVASGSTVGASACVTRSVDAGSVVVGIPARPLASRDHA